MLKIMKVLADVLALVFAPVPAAQGVSGAGVSPASGDKDNWWLCLPATGGTPVPLLQPPLGDELFRIGTNCNGWPDRPRHDGKNGCRGDSSIVALSPR